METKIDGMKLYEQLSPQGQELCNQLAKYLIRRISPEEGVAIVDYLLNFYDSHRDCL